eukprot:gene3075-5852_t
MRKGGSEEDDGLALAVRVGYGLMALALSSVHNVFLIYHVDAYVNVFGISFNGFWIAEFLFLLYNSFNDVIWGMLADSQMDTSRVDAKGLTLRIRNTVAGGIGLSLAFLLMWFPLTSRWIALQFCFNLIFYDTFLTWVELNLSALLADLALCSAGRSDLTAWRSQSTFADTNIHDWYCLQPKSVSVFQRSALQPMRISSITNITANPTAPPNTQQHISVWTWFYDFKRIIFRHNFMWFSLLHLIQQFLSNSTNRASRDASITNATSTFVDVREISVWTKLSVITEHASLILSLSFTLPHINNIFFSKLVKRYGSYVVIAGLIATKILIAGMTAAAGSSSWGIIAVYVASNRIFTEGTCKLLGLVLSDLVDEDYVRGSRISSKSAFVFGAANFIAKPGQTLAPLIGSYILKKISPGLIFDEFDVNSSRLSTESNMSKDNLEESTIRPVVETDDMRQGLFYLMTMLPLVCGVIQLLAWSQYRLRGSVLYLTTLQANDKEALNKLV